MLGRISDREIAGFRIELHQKDLNLALTVARQIGMSLPDTAVPAVTTR